MLALILQLLGLAPKVLGTVDNITNAIANEKIAGLQATTQEARIASDERVAALQGQLQLQLSDNQKSSIDIYERAIAGFPAILITWKLLVWDWILGWGTTAIPAGSPVWTLIFMVYGFYFLHSIIK